MSSLFVCPHFSQSLPDILNIKNILELTTPKFSCVHSLYYHELCNTLYPRGVTWGKTIVSNSVPLKLDYTQYPFLKKPSHKKNLLIFYPLHYTVDLHPKDCFGTFWNLPPNQECLIMILLCTIEIAYKKPYFSFEHLL